MSVVGIDIGNENSVIAVLKDRGIDILLNDESNRETPAVVSFGEKQRFIGASGAASATMNPKSTISQVKRLVGRKYAEPDLQNEVQRMPFETCEGPDGSVLVRLQYMGETHTFSPTQILGMLLAHLKEMIEKNIESPILECVVGIPSYFTDLQRRAYVDAATIAGLKPLRLMHDCTATALGYGIYRVESSSKKPTNVVFVDIGHCDTQVSVVSFERGQMKILSHDFDSNLGGRDFDEVLYNFFASQINHEYNIDVKSSVKASVRLRSSCEKLKKVLSANAGAPLNIECLMDEVDVRGFIKREEFEKLSSDLLERIRIPCCKALTDSGVNVGSIHSVELVGSGSRVPSIGKMLTAVFQREISRTVNASECVARGCALQCAMLSPNFRVRDYEVQDLLPFSIGFSSDKGPVCTLSNSVLFPKGSPIPNLKILKLSRTRMFPLEAYFVDQNEVPSCISPKISNFMIGPIQASNMSTAKVKVKVSLNLHGIVAVESATLVEEELDDPIKMSNDEKNLKFAEVKLGKGSVTRHSEDVSRAKFRTSANEMRSGKTIKKLELPVSESVYGGMTKAELAEAEEKELQLSQQDLKVERATNKRNALESYVYEMRDKIENSYRGFATGREREVISRNLQKIKDWLYEDEIDESENFYTKKIKYLHKLIDPVENRYKEEEARSREMSCLSMCILDLQRAAESLPEAERNVVFEECNRAEKWLQEKIQQQSLLPQHADPIVWSTDVKEISHSLCNTCRKIMKSTSKKPLAEEEVDPRNMSDHMEID